VEWAAVVRRPLARPAENEGAASIRAATIDDQPVRAFRQFKGQSRCTSASCNAPVGRRCRIHHDNRLSRRCPLITPIARLSLGPGSHAAGRNDRFDLRCFDREAPLPAGKPAVSQCHTQKRGHREIERTCKECGPFNPTGVIDPAEHGKEHHGIKLTARRSADEPAVGGKAGVECARQSRFTKTSPRSAARNQQASRNNSGPGGNSLQPDRSPVSRTV
jgi:hypothetical protein